jgi:hypothetical protein
LPCRETVSRTLADASPLAKKRIVASRFTQAFGEEKSGISLIAEDATAEINDKVIETLTMLTSKEV